MVSLPPGTIRNYNIQLQNESPFMFTILNLTNTITNLLLGAVAMNAFVYANLMSSPKSLIISQHIYLCVFGYVILMVQAIHSVNIHTGWARAFSCNNKRAVHYILQTIGSILGIAGCLRIILTNGPHHNRNHTTLHTIFGYVAMALTILSLIGGVINLYSSQIGLSIKCTRIGHTILGSFTIVFAFLSMASFPITEEISKKKYLGDTNEKIFIALIIIALILILASPIMNVRRMLA